MSLILIDREPEPGEVAVPREEDVYLEIHSTGSDAVDDTETNVYIDDVLAYSAGTFQAGFNGPNSSTFSAASGSIRQIQIDLVSDFASEQVVTVRVTSATVVAIDALFEIDESYSFTVEDFAAPMVSSAFAVDCKTVRVVFSETMRAVLATNSDDALNPANYTIDRLNPATTAAANATVTIVVAESPSEFLLSTDIELSFGITYSVTVLNAEDPSGNEVLPPLNVAQFVAHTPAVPAGRLFDLYRMLPAVSRREDTTKDLLKFTSIIQDVINVLLFDIDAWTNILDFRLAGEDFVDAILCGLGNPFSFELTLADKRRLAAVLIDIYREKGLAEGIENAILFFMGLTVTVDLCVPLDGWVLGESELGFDTYLSTSEQALLYSFEVTSLIILTVEQRAQITKLADYMKPAHTHLKQITEPAAPVVIDHWELGLSELGDTTLLH